MWRMSYGIVIRRLIARTYCWAEHAFLATSAKEENEYDYGYRNVKQHYLVG